MARIAVITRRVMEEWAWGCLHWRGLCRSFPVVMTRLVNSSLEEAPGKVVGRRRAPANGLSIEGARRIEDARAWQRALRTLSIPKGVYRFRTHEEADDWLWQMLTRPRR